MMAALMAAAALMAVAAVAVAMMTVVLLLLLLLMLLLLLLLLLLPLLLLLLLLLHLLLLLLAGLIKCWECNVGQDECARRAGGGDGGDAGGSSGCCGPGPRCVQRLLQELWQPLQLLWQKRATPVLMPVALDGGGERRRWGAKIHRRRRCSARGF